MTMIQQMILAMQNRPSSVKHPPNRLKQWALAKNNRKEKFERTPLISSSNTHCCQSSDVICCFHSLLIIWNLRELITGYTATGLRMTGSRLLSVIPVPKNWGALRSSTELELPLIFWYIELYGTVGMAQFIVGITE